MKELPIVGGKYALVDDEDFERCNQFSWYLHEGGTKIYVIGSMAKRKKVLLHRFILAPELGIQIDHINHDGLDNRKENLRLVTNMQNSTNVRPGVRNKSGIVGVNWSKHQNRWEAQIQVNGKKLKLGSYHSLYLAARVRKEAEIKYGFLSAA